jgi:predicted dehydrogenase
MMPSLGQLKRISSAFSFYGDKQFYAGNIRVDPKLEPFGCLGDLGWYCIRLALWVTQEQLPSAVTGRILRELRGIPTEFSGELFFRGGLSSSFYCSFDTATEQWAIIAGSKGSARMQDFVLPFFGDEIGIDLYRSDLVKNGCDFNMEPRLSPHQVDEYSNSHQSSQETNLFRNFAAQVQSGKLNREWPEIALNTQRVMEACLASAKKGSRVQTCGATD